LKKPLLFISIILIALAIWTMQNQAAELDLDFIVGQKHKGVCWVAGPRPLEGWELDSLRAFGATHISQTPFGWQQDPKTPEIRWEQHSDRMWWGERLAGLEATLTDGRNSGLESILKPHLWVHGAWPGEIEMQSEAHWAEWFMQYGEFIGYFADFAEKHQIPVLCIGTELEKTVHREADWRKIIENIRSRYRGRIVYAANFTEYDKIKFWDALDYIGIQAYFPLAESENPSQKELDKTWGKVIPQIEKVVSNFQKPVIFTEIGYCNTADAAVSPWIWPHERKGTEVSEQVQAKCYQAFFDNVWKKDWLAGVYFWKWYPQVRGSEIDFTPQGKEAAEVMRREFLGEI
jgi:hypothetical protein